MENPLPDQTKVFSINLHCCEKCPVTLNKMLQRLNGVDKFSIDIENNLVYVEGEIDATTFINYIAVQNKKATLVTAEKLNQMRNESRGNNSAAPKREKMHESFCREDGRRRRSTKEQQVEHKEPHKCEAYVPPAIDPRVCRDFYCKTHPRGRLIVDKVSAESANFFSMGHQMPFYGTYGPYGGGVPYQYPGWSWEDSPMPTYGYGQPPMNLPFHPFGHGYQ